MSSKNVRLLSRAPSDPTFLFVLKILFFVAGIQFLAASLIFAPRLVANIAGYFASKTKDQEFIAPIAEANVIAAVVKNGKKEELKKEELLAPLKTEKKITSFPSPVSLQATLAEKELSTKTVSSGTESGFQEGDSLGIISVQHAAGAAGEHILKIAIKAQSHEPIAVSEVKVQVYFYDQIAGEVAASKSPVTSRWLKAPVEWKDGEPELLEVTYQPDNNNPDAHYLGYIVAVYYKGELQGYRANPPAITNQFPIKVYIGRNGNEF